MRRKQLQESPLDINISFNMLLKRYEDLLTESADPELIDHAKKVLAVAEAYPELREGTSDLNRIAELKPQIDLILRDSFSPILTHNEIKTAGIPFEGLIFKSSQRFDDILAKAPDDYEFEIRNMPEGHIYIMACSVILKAQYGIDVQFRRPLYFDIPDEQGILKHYRITYNADFVELLPTDKAKELTPEDIEELIDGFNDLELWKEKIPPGSWLFKGFVISNIFDVTLDNAISELKTWLLNSDSERFTDVSVFQKIFQSLFGIKDLHVGFLNYDPDLDTFDQVSHEVPCFMLDKENNDCHSVMCRDFKDNILNKHEYFAISNIDKYHEVSNGAEPYASYFRQGFKSAILAPITHKGQLLGVLELLSPKTHQLNSVNAHKLTDIMAFIVAATIRTKQEKKNRIEAIIQNEYTSLHRSVRWKFVKEAKRYLSDLNNGITTSLKDITFKEVYPLYGQIDIRNSSVVRNEATKKDLGDQLNALKAIFREAITSQGLPIYEEYIFQIDSFLNEINKNFRTNSEALITEFLENEIHPALEAVAALNNDLSNLVQAYRSELNDPVKMYYTARQRYDTTVKRINKEMARVIDEKHKEAYAMFPHYFERYKTDGVEHNMYIGQSIANNRKFEEVYLQNLKLWQLQTMCHMENMYYNLKPQLAIPMEVASLILVHSSPLSIRFRMDEKHFDVDGTYNARYEILKKRIDKVHIKGTKKRVTEPGKITIIYSQKQEEAEYLRYIRLLQAKQVLAPNVKIHELEDLQGVSGLRAITVGILYKKEDQSPLLSYDELMEEISK
ncbi:GAF domain-containing protein [Robertkochia sediminum]|uniref:GAF domain-containing protein n=1 Tax=Robertkochia sediminum TaxID=2785326 RepID=UPI001931D76C|nr:GAF domain-containing protein [Robertkochia sediminum]MBL7473990.1 GAF domain-containing protein [Robertkochia sediminum]